MNAMLDALTSGVRCEKQCRGGKTHSSVLRVCRYQLQWKRKWYHLRRWGKLALKECGEVSAEGETVVVHHMKRDLVVVVKDAADVVLALKELRERELAEAAKSEERLVVF